MPEWMSPYFCFPALTAAELGIVGVTLDGKVLEASDVVYPCAGPCPMGFSWSLYFAQHGGEGLLKEQPRLRDSPIVNDLADAVVLSPLTLPRHYLYVDNCGILERSRARARAAILEASSAFSGRGQPVHDLDVSVGPVDMLGT